MVFYGKVHNFNFLFVYVKFYVTIPPNFILYQESMDKWMTKPNMGYIIVSRYNVIFVCLLAEQ